MTRENQFDVAIVGGGPAGLSAALILGRSRRRVLLADAGHPRNAPSRALHGYLTRDGVAPATILRLGRRELARYPTVEIREAEVTAARVARGGFRLSVGGRTAFASKLLLATGLTDDVPDVPGMREHYGRGVFHCPYCDGFEVRDRPIAVYGRGSRGRALASEILFWSANVVLLTDGPSRFSPRHRKELSDRGIAVRSDRVLRIEGNSRGVTGVVLENGPTIPAHALFFTQRARQQSPLAANLGCRFTSKGVVDTGRYQSTNVPGLFVAGDASRDVQFVIVAAAEGAEAAVRINSEMMREELAARSSRGGRSRSVRRKF